MSDLKLFRIGPGAVVEIPSQSVAVEKSLQTLIEMHSDAFLGVRFLASEYVTGKAHGGRIDTLGVDENGYPVIIEYKRALNENVINQGLFYLDWLMDHKADFTLLVMNKLGAKVADKIEWSNPRLLCIAGDFTKYDGYAVQQINRSIELIRYRRYGNELLALELVNATTPQSEPDNKSARGGRGGKSPVKTVSDHLDDAPPALQDCYELLKAFLLALGDDVRLATLNYYHAFKRIKNFACIEVRPSAGHLLAYVKVNPDTVDLEANKGFLRDVRKIGIFGTGDLEVTIRNPDDLERAKPYLLTSYEGS